MYITKCLFGSYSQTYQPLIRYRKVDSWLTQMFSGVLDLTSYVFNFALTSIFACVAFNFAQVSLTLFNITYISKISLGSL